MVAPTQGRFDGNFLLQQTGLKWSKLGFQTKGGSMKLGFQGLYLAGAVLAFCGFANAQGVTEREVLVGQFAAMSGASAELGQRLRAGIAAYFARVNAQGGVAGAA